MIMPLTDEESLFNTGSFIYKPNFFCADCHCDTITRTEPVSETYPQHIKLDDIHKYLQLQFTAIYIKEEKNIAIAKSDCLNYYERYKNLLSNHSNLFPIWEKSDLDKLGKGKTGTLLAMENCTPLGESVEAVEFYKNLGFKSFGLFWNNENPLGCGAFAVGGLSKVGKTVVRELEKEKLIIDLAHSNEKSFYEVLNIASKGIIVTHTCCDSLYHHKRNLSDMQIKDIGSVNGLVGITYARSFMADNGTASIDNVIDNIINCASLIGAENVCLGSDFDGTDLPKGIEGPQSLQSLAKKMLERSFTKTEIANIMGNNIKNFLIKNLE